jgi:glycosyltransferase involved in cell wall biosynthesis
MSAGDDPRAVAVVIPVWDDYVRWLAEAVESVLAQAVAAQVVVVDNASAEPVPELPGTMVIRTPYRLSTGGARNLGLAAVTTPLVVFLDADDMFLPGALVPLVHGMAMRPDMVALGSSRIEADTGRRHRSPRPLAALLARRPAAFAFANAVWSLVPTQGTMVMRTELVRAAGGYADRSQGEDWVLGVSLAWRGPIGFDSRMTLLYRWRGDSPGGELAEPPLLANASCVRKRMREDPGVPIWARASLPLVCLLQWGAALVVRPVFRRLRGAMSRSLTGRR